MQETYDLEHVPKHHAGDNPEWNTFGEDGVGILRRPKRITRNHR